jgi:hypothetical protein
MALAFRFFFFAISYFLRFYPPPPSSFFLERAVFIFFLPVFPPPIIFFVPVYFHQCVGLKDVLLECPFINGTLYFKEVPALKCLENAQSKDILRY